MAQPFSVVRQDGIGIYYVDDDSNVGDQYTPDAVGDDANDGLTPLTPKASIQAVLDAYDLQPGDIILVDTGIYGLTGETSSSLATTPATLCRASFIRGPTDSGKAAVIDRADTADGAIGFQLLADFITLSHLDLTGAWRNVVVDSGAEGIVLDTVTARDAADAPRADRRVGHDRAEFRVSSRAIRARAASTAS